MKVSDNILRNTADALTPSRGLGMSCWMYVTRDFRIVQYNKAVASFHVKK